MITLNDIKCLDCAHLASFHSDVGFQCQACVPTVVRDIADFDEEICCSLSIANVLLNILRDQNFHRDDTRDCAIQYLQSLITQIQENAYRVRDVDIHPIIDVLRDLK